MSALPDGQPLTRRQARASERARLPESDGQDGSSEAKAAEAAERAAEPAEQAAAAEQAARAAAEAEAVADEAAWAPPAPVDAAAAAAEATAEAEEAAEHESELLEGIPERTLTRRELRALLAAQAAARAAAEEAAGTSGAAPASDIDEDAPTPAPVAPQPPVGHWSLDIDVEDDADDHGFDQVLSRGVGAGGVPTTTNALILPLIPQQGGDVQAPLAGGEMLVTGSIDLPSLGDTGAHPHRIDSPEVDRLLDQVDDASPATSAQPVRASKAVSTHTSTRDTLTPPKQGGLNMPTVLAITAAVLALGVIGLFIGGYIFKIF
ncbi:hypothetical protein [Microterricola pindariensis]|uniref:Uncharacterized protein n=1 Tax=Microterricola pindariensis TaxID=478010 RepID=A0ABX5B1T6_9MICO|nr:hypothetical protein [Microterricola pindariensis]PPL20496.1 hypothetical protein GY24_00210 [Microterricola pindariensis]